MVNPEAFGQVPRGKRTGQPTKEWLASLLLFRGPVPGSFLWFNDFAELNFRTSLGLT